MKPRRHAGAAIGFALAVAVLCGFAGCSSSTVSQSSSSDAGPGEDGPRGDARIGADGAGDAAGDAAGDGDAPSGRPLCFVSCNTTDDCVGNGGGTCTNKICVRFAGGIDACKVDPDCVPYGSSFEIDKPCTARANCRPNEACIAFKGAGICHLSPTATDAATPCSSYFAMVELDWPSIEGPAVKICGRTSYVCDEGKCHDGCGADADCTLAAFPKCDTTRHKCVCSGASCAGGAFTGSVCLSDGRCGCGTNADCKVSGFDRCYVDMCGCSGDGACADLVQTAPLVCVPSPP